MENKSGSIEAFNPYYPWDKEVLAEAVESVQEGKVSLEEASDEFSIPLSVLSQALSGHSHNEDQGKSDGDPGANDSETMELVVMQRKLPEIESIRTSHEQAGDYERIIYIEPRGMNEEGDKQSVNSEAVNSDDDAQSEEYFYLENVDNKIRMDATAGDNQQQEEKSDDEKVICVALNADSIEADQSQSDTENIEDNATGQPQLNMSWPGMRSNATNSEPGNDDSDSEDKAWSAEALATAYDNVVNGKMSQRQAAKLHGIPRTTLQKYCSGVRSIAKLNASGKKKISNRKLKVTAKRRYLKKVATRSAVKVCDISKEVADLSPKERLNEAYKAVMEKKMDIKDSSRYYGVPVSTLKGWASGRVKKPTFLYANGQTDETIEKKKKVNANKKPKDAVCAIAEEYLYMDKIDRMKLAYEAVTEKSMPIKQASQTFGIARSTMRAWARGKTKPSFIYEQNRTPVSDEQIAKSREVFYRLINSGIVQKLESEQAGQSTEQASGATGNNQTSTESQASGEQNSDVSEQVTVGATVVSTPTGTESMKLQTTILPRGKPPSYKPLDLINAYKDVVEKHTPIKRAARMYGVPKSTLQAWVKGKVKRPLCFQPAQKQSAPSTEQVAKSREIFSMLKTAFPVYLEQLKTDTNTTEGGDNESGAVEHATEETNKELVDKGEGGSVEEKTSKCESQPTEITTEEDDKAPEDTVSTPQPLEVSTLDGYKPPEITVDKLPPVRKFESRQPSYKAEDLLKAYKAVVEDQMPLKKAARTFKVPRSTLQCWVTGKVTLPKCFVDCKIPGIKVTHKKPEPKRIFPVFTPTDESGIFNKAINMQLAYREVVFGKMPIKRAARMYGVPRTTLQNWVVGKTKMPLCLQQSKSGHTEVKRYDLSSKLLPLAKQPKQKDDSEGKQSDSADTEKGKKSGESTSESPKNTETEGENLNLGTDVISEGEPLNLGPDATTEGKNLNLMENNNETNPWLGMYKGAREYKPYTLDPEKQENLLQAFKSVIEDGMPVKRAARHYNVPRSTLQGWVKGKVRTPLFLRQAGDKSGNKRKADPDEEGQEGVKKPRRKRNINRKPWSKEVMDLAVKAIKDNKMPIRTAARIFDLPRSTLQDYLKGKQVEFKLGPNSILTVEEEKSLIGWITTSAIAGVIVSKESVLEMVKKILNNKGKKGFRTVDNKPSDNWFKKFVKKHEELRKIFTNIDNEPDEKSESDTPKRKPGPKRKKKEKVKENTNEETLSSPPPPAPPQPVPSPTPILLPRDMPMPTTTTALPNAATFTREMPPIPKTIGGTSMFFPRSCEAGILNIPRSDVGVSMAHAMNMIPDNIVSSTFQRPPLLNSAIEMLTRLPFVCSICGGPCSLNDNGEPCIQCKPLPGSSSMRSCRGWFHVRCTELFNSHLSKEEIKRLNWSCPACTAVGLVQEYAHMT